MSDGRRWSRKILRIEVERKGNRTRLEMRASYVESRWAGLINIFLLVLWVIWSVAYANSKVVDANRAHFQDDDDDVLKWFVVTQSPQDEHPLIEWSANTNVSVCALDTFHFLTKFPVSVETKTARALIESKARGYFLIQLVAHNVDGIERGAVLSSSELHIVRILSSNLPSNNESGTIADQVTTVIEEEDSDAESTSCRLECDLDTPFCTPTLLSINFPDVNTHDQESINDKTDDISATSSSVRVNHSIILTFAEPTNRPSVTNKKQIEDLIAFPVYLGDKMTGMWSEDGRVLSIKVLDIDESRLPPLAVLMEALPRTTIVCARDTSTDANTGRTNDFDDAYETVLLHGEWTFRIEPTGEFDIVISSPDNRLSTFDPISSPIFSVSKCESSSLVLYSSSTIVKKTPLPNRRITFPTFQLHGIITHAGQEGYILPHDMIGISETMGSWSLNMWVFLAQDSTGSFRTLFYNGNGQGEQRTPSAWWKPNDRRLVLRVSTEMNADVGLDSNQELPLRQWVNLGFTFRNATAATHTDMASMCREHAGSCKNGQTWYYAITFLVNGVIDQEVLVYAPAIPNMGPLHMGKGPWTNGMEGFISNLRVFASPLLPDEHHAYYMQEKDMHRNFNNLDTSLDANTMDLLKAAAVNPTTQISYLAQVFTPMESQHTLDQNDPMETNLLMTPILQQDEDAFGKLRAHIFNKAVLAVERCDVNAWDLLKEAADLGHPDALFDIGTSHLYGEYKFPDKCSKQILTALPVELNFETARDALEKALHGGHWDAGKPLALAAVAGVSKNAQRLKNFTIGLYHLAATTGQKDSFAILGHRYKQGEGISSQVAIAAYYYYHAAIDASIAYHEHGQEPLHEMNRLYDAFHDNIAKGQLGDDDELIQFQQMRADKDGDVGAMTAMGDLYYWGVRGIVRNQARAFQYYHRAATRGHVGAQTAVAGMLLKGEGVPQDNTSAIAWYERAAKQNHTRALNGLGFIHFHGSGGVEENKTAALEYFERAAANEEDGDSAFNAGYCHAFGLGTVVNVTRAMQYYDVAARKFGHFDAIFEMGKIWMNGVDGIVQPSMDLAVTYLKAAAEGGRWGKTMRNGFELFLNNDFQRAAIYYHEASEYGYPIATSNLAYLYDQKLLIDGDRISEQRALEYLLRTSHENHDKEALLRIGDYYFYGRATILQPDYQEAIRWYSRASAEGVEAGAYNVGYMYDYGIGIEPNWDRAERYYHRVLELSSGSMEALIVVRLALARIRLCKWMHQTPLERWLFGMNCSPTRTNILSEYKEPYEFMLNIWVSSCTTAVLITIGIWYFRRTTR